MRSRQSWCLHVRLTDGSGLCKLPIFADGLQDNCTIRCRNPGLGRGQGTYQKLSTMKEKALILVVCLFGILGVSYGMMNKDHLLFVAGLVFVVAGYLMIRKKLKEYIREKYHSEDDRGRTPGP